MSQMDTTNKTSFVFSNNNKSYKYDFNYLTVEQVELAREVGEFKKHQIESQADSFKSVLKSGGAEWLSVITAYLLREVKNSETLSFNKDKAESEVLTFVKNLPSSEIENLRLCISDFFSNIGSPQIGSILLTREQKQNVSNLLLPIMQKIMLSGYNGNDL